MIKTKFVFAVSLVAMLAVGSAWAYDPADTSSTTDTVATEHTVYTDQAPTTGAGIAGVSYVNRAVNKAGAAATAAEAHAAAAGASALAAAESAAVAASSAQSAKDTLVKKQPISTANYQMGNASGSWTTMTAAQQDALNSGVTSKTKVTHTASTAVGSANVPVYVDADGTVKQITSYNGTAAKATADASGNTITTTYEKLSNKYMTTTKGIEITDDNKDTYYPSIGKVQSMIEGYVDDQIATYDEGIGTTLDNLTNTKQDKLTAANVTTTGTGNVVTAVSASGGKVTVTKGVSVNNATLTIKNGATSEDLATFTANSSTGATATIPAASATVAGLAKIGVIPSGYETASEYAAIWVE